MSGNILAGLSPGRAGLYFHDTASRDVWNAGIGSRLSVAEAERLLFAEWPTLIPRAQPVAIVALDRTTNTLGLHVAATGERGPVKKDDRIAHVDSLAEEFARRTSAIDFHYLAEISSLNPHADLVYVRAMDTRPSLQKQGIATAATRALFAFGDKAGWQHAEATVDNPAAFRTWSKLGYMPEEETRDILMELARRHSEDETLPRAQRSLLASIADNPNAPSLSRLMRESAAVATRLVDNGLFARENDDVVKYVSFDLRNPEQRGVLAVAGPQKPSGPGSAPIPRP